MDIRLCVHSAGRHPRRFVFHLKQVHLVRVCDIIQVHGDGSPCGHYNQARDDGQQVTRVPSPSANGPFRNKVIAIKCLKSEGLCAQ